MPIDRRPRPGGRLGRARGADLYGVRFDGHEPLRPLSTTTRRSTLDGAGARPRRLPGRGRPDPRGRDRVRPLPLPRRRRPHPPPRRAPLLQAPRARACREGKTLDEGLAYAARACGACAVANARRLRARVRGGARARADGRARAARARSCSSSSGVWSHLNDIAAVCAGVGLAAGNNRFAALTERARRLNASAHRPPLPLRHRPRRRQRRSTLDATRCARRARRARARSRGGSRAAWRELLFNASFQDRSPTSASSRATMRSVSAPSGPRRAPPGVAEDARARSPRLAYDGFAPVVAGAAGRRRAGAVRAARARALADVRRSSTRLLDGPLAPRGADAAATSARSASAASRARAARPAASSSARRPARAAAPAHRLLRELARRRACRGRTTCCPTSRSINKSFELCYACADR